MKDKITSKELVDATDWLATIFTNEKESKYIVDKGVSGVTLKFYLRAEGISIKFRNMIKRKRADLIKKGWNIGENLISNYTKELFIFASTSESVSCVELDIKFNVGMDNILKEIQDKEKTINETIDMLTASIEDIKMSMDVMYSVNKNINITEKKIQSVFDNLALERIQNVKGKYRKFKIIDKHNITDQITLTKANANYDLDISIDVENIVVDKSNLDKEIEASIYYLAIEYAKLHYNIIKVVDKDYLTAQQKFYKKIENIF